MKSSLFLQILAFVFIRVVLNTMLRMVYPFLPVFARGLGVDLGAMALGLSIRSATGIFGPFLASIADIRGRKTGMLLGLFFYILGASLVIAWPVFPVFVLTLVLTILGNFIFIASLQAYIGDRVEYKRRGRALAFIEFGWSLAFIAGVPAVGLVIARWGWQAPFPLLAGLGLLALILLYWLLPGDEKPVGIRTPLMGNLRRIIGYKPALAGLLFGMLICAANDSITVVFGAWLEDSFGLQIAALGAASAVIGLSELGGEVFVGGLSDFLGKKRSMLLGVVLNCLAVLALPLFSQTLAGTMVGLFLFYFTFEFTLVSTIPMMSEVFPSARATLMALFVASTSIGHGLGALTATPLYDFLPSISGNIFGAVFMNILAFIALTGLWRHGEELAA